MYTIGHLFQFIHSLRSTNDFNMKSSVPGDWPNYQKLKILFLLIFSGPVILTKWLEQSCYVSVACCFSIPVANFYSNSECFLLIFSGFAASFSYRFFSWISLKPPSKNEGFFLLMSGTPNYMYRPLTANTAELETIWKFLSLTLNGRFRRAISLVFAWRYKIRN